MGKRGIKIPVKKKEISKYLHNVWIKKNEKNLNMTRVTHIHVHADIFKFEMISYFYFYIKYKKSSTDKRKKKREKKENNIEPLKNNWKISRVKRKNQSKENLKQ